MPSQVKPTIFRFQIFKAMSYLTHSYVLWLVQMTFVRKSGERERELFSRGLVFQSRQVGGRKGVINQGSKVQAGVRQALRTQVRSTHVNGSQLALEQEKEAFIIQWSLLYCSCRTHTYVPGTESRKRRKRASVTRAFIPCMKKKRRREGERLKVFTE